MAMPRISDVVNTGQLVGPRVQVSDLIGKDFIAKSVLFRPGQAGSDFAIVQCYHCNPTGEIGPEDAFWFLCGGRAVVESLRKAEPALPLLCKIGQVISGKGRKVLTIV